VTREPAALAALAEAGMNVARLNFSHGSYQEHAEAVRTIRELSAKRGEAIAILQDLSGPKVRVGNMKNGSATLEKGQEVQLTSREIEGDERQVPISIPVIIDSVPVGSHLLLDDGLLDLQVTALKSDALVCKVIVGGPLASHKGVNAPGVSLPIASVTDKDLEDLQFGIQQKVDWIAASFVRNASDIAVLRGVCNASRAKIPLMAKIEKHEAVRNIDEIIAVVDGIMVARGDLGVEIPIDEVPVVQKMIIAKCNAAGKPVITATQMLDSMIRNPRPTRAEVSDVANAIYDGTDAVMLSGETAVGLYPLPSVHMMDEIARYTEPFIDYKQTFGEHITLRDDADSITQAIALATCDVARDLKASAIITATTSGRTALAVSRFRPKMPIIAATDRAETYQRLAMVWGAYPVQVNMMDNSDHMMEACIEAAKSCQAVKEGDVVVLTGGVPVGRPGSTNFIKVHRIGQPLLQ
jgi:pyruvate kinase